MSFRRLIVEIQENLLLYVRLSNLILHLHALKSNEIQLFHGNHCDHIPNSFQDRLMHVQYLLKDFCEVLHVLHSFSLDIQCHDRYPSRILNPGPVASFWCYQYV